jgi:hypothetical protein
LEAIERWTPRELWEPYLRIREYDLPIVPLPGSDPRYDEAQRLRWRIAEILVEKLVRREFIASGITFPLNETSRRRDISTELWPELTFDYQFAKVVGPRIEYRQVLIRAARPRTLRSRRREQDAAPPPAQPDHAPGRGRPSIMPKIEAEMRRRAASGQLEAWLRREAEALAAWAKRKFPDEHIPLPRSIEKRLRHVYRELKRIKRPDKGADKR